MSRQDAMRAFLAGSGFEDARIEPLAQDASFRRYWRLTGALGGAVLMDAPAPEDVRPFLRIAAHLEAIGLSVPRVFKADAEAGFVLEEDLGDGLLSVVLDGVTGSGLGGGAPDRGTTLNVGGIGPDRGTTLNAGGIGPDRGTMLSLGSRGSDRGTTPPPPLRGRAGVGGDRGSDGGVSTPPPVPLPQGEGGRGGAAGVPTLTANAAAVPSPEVTTAPPTTVLPPTRTTILPTTVLHAAIDALIPLQRAAPPPGLPAWSAQAMAETALGTMFDWWWPATFGAPAPNAARAEVGTALATILAPLRDGPRCFVHRDFFAGNLLWLPDRAAAATASTPTPGAFGPLRPGASGPLRPGAFGPRAIGIIDFQGAAIGHPAYDLVSLLQDARRDIPADIAAEVLARYLALRPELDPAAFRAAYAACAAQRHLRVACQWVRLALRDDRPQYLAYGPRTWRLLSQALTEPAVAPLARALDRWIPAAQRRNPPGLAA